jgi:Leu/Phe-tRNA-protein transferase
MFLYYTETGFLVVQPQDDLRLIVNAMLETGYDEEFCISLDFDPDFIARLMGAGFLVMSARLFDDESGENVPSEEGSPSTEGGIQYILLPRLHLTRSVLFLDKLHIKKSIRRYLPRYELRFDTDFDYIIDRCIEIHGDYWLTPPLISAIRNIRQKRLYGKAPVKEGVPSTEGNVYPVSFSLYRDGKLVAGDFGVIVGRVYTSYSGYYDETNSGTVQLILSTRYLQEHGFALFDFGMPMDYKTDLGAINVSPEEFVTLFRSAQ